jgi:RND family efflux transporter MFP subunit
MKKRLALISMVLLTACTPPPQPPAPPKVVRTLIVGVGELATRGTYPGEIRSRYESNLGFRVPGKLVVRLVDAGSVVSAGQTLARLDVTDASLQASQAEAQRALADADAKRFRDLKAKGFVSQAVLDAREVALKAAEAQAGLAKNQAAYNTLVADRSGVIAAVAAEPGQVLAAGQAVVRLAPDGEREVAIAVPEAMVQQLKPGMPADVRLWSEGKSTDEKPMPGKLREIAPAADPVTRTYAARVSLPGAPARLPLGLTATVRFPALVDKMIRVPMASIFQKGSEAAVWVVNANNTVSLKPVTVTAYADNDAIIASGLAEGERIVTAGVHKLSEGETVRLGEAAK